ncbi:MAG TPA: HEAT repeat domain-containing protein [Kofleriaceae bacterium]|nr:HEAT repeat domain-containing protein [Kofleriaceae bacterium]
MGLVALLLALAATHGGGRPARAERVHDLSRALLHGKHVKTRLSAATALDRMRDPRALRSLMQALGDASYMVRELAAVALGHLGDPTALPALEGARSDPRRAVRRQVLAAIDLIRDKQRRARGASAARAPLAGGAPVRGAGGLAYQVPGPKPGDPPPIYVMLKSTSDKSAGGAALKVRKMRAQRMRSLMATELAHGKQVTLLPTVSRDPSVDRYAIDLTVVKLARVERGPHVEVECEIRVAISTREGRMLSFLTGGAKVQVPRVSFREDFLPQLRGEALEGAVRSVHRDLVSYLLKLPQPAPPPALPAAAIVREQ